MIDVHMPLLTNDEACMQVSKGPRGTVVLQLDGGCTSHCKRNGKGMINVKAVSGLLTVANGQKVEIVGIGDWPVHVVYSDGVVRMVTFRNVLIVPGLHRDLISHAKIDDAGATITTGNRKGTITMDGMSIPIRRVDDRYVIDIYEEPPAS